MTAQTKSELRPFIPLLVGQGKLAKHLSFYLTQKSIPFKHWPNARDLSSPELKKLLKEVSLVWILVSDRAIAEVSSRLKEIAPELTYLHASAATEVKNTLTLHPLQTIGPDLYSLSIYEKTPFVFIREEWIAHLDLKETLLQSFSNPTFEIKNENRTLYHAYCVMVANFPQMLWGTIFDEAKNKLDQDSNLFGPLLAQAAQNFLSHGKDALTGPLVRGDQATLQKHESVLAGSPLLPIYQNFVSLFSASQPKSHSKEIS
jgi:predicted short-subunit dehydrogenase-like oxidoreductase (DUF2520 family)